MSNPSNIYAEKIFAEHPLALWAFDDQSDYISLLSENYRNLDNWVVTIEDTDVGTPATLVHPYIALADVVGEPFPESATYQIVGEQVASDSGQIIAVSDRLINFTELDPTLSTFSIAGYFYSETPYVAGYEIGYEYDETTTGEVVQVLKSFDTSIKDRWVFVSETFDIPRDDTEARIVFKINYVSGAPETDPYNFYVNGITFGQWSEEFNSTSLGVTPVAINNVANLTADGVEAKAYGLGDASGYYLANATTVFAKNSGIPLVYGASNATLLKPNTPGKPSAIIPGKGFLNENGRYKEYTVEMWMRISADTADYKRVFGPLGSTDGLYVGGPFITLNIGSTAKSYFVGEWYRPMLIQIKYGNTYASLVINGEEVINFEIDPQSLSLPEEFIDGVNNDWLGFYAYDDVSPIELDCVAIYPYNVPDIVAKRRWAYGQAVEFPENINTAYSGTSVYIDFPFSKYTNNYSYPKIGSWKQGVLENVSIADGSLGNPQYVLPKVYSNSNDEALWYSDNADIQNESDLYFKIKPDTGNWDTSDGYLLFDTFKVINEKVASVYGAFKRKEANAADEILFHIEDQTTGNYFQIRLGADIEYVIKYNSEEQVFARTMQYNVGEIFSVGFNIKMMSDYFGGNVAAFFGKSSLLKMYVGGNKDLDKTFNGNIYAIGIASKRNTKKISDSFAPNGLIADFNSFITVKDGETPSASTWQQYVDAGLYSQTFWQYVYDGGSPAAYATIQLLDHIASYTLKPQSFFGGYDFDIATDSYWEDYTPLSYFGKYTQDINGDSRYALNFLQFNVNYPAPSKYVQEEVASGWQYGELHNQFSIPVQRQYSSLDNQLFTGYENYTDLKNNSTKSYKFDTSQSLVKTYITFQYISTGANAHQAFFTNTVLAPKNGIVDPGSDGEDWTTTKYEVVDNMILYPPRNVDFRDLALVVHVEMQTQKSLKEPIKIKTLQIVSQAFDEMSPSEIGTRFGSAMYPYRKNGVYYDYSGKNPFSIYKGSTPYLYMTKTSGIKIRGGYDPLVNRGVSIPINTSKNNPFKVMAMQAAIRFDEDVFPYAPTEIFEIRSKDVHLKFYMVVNSISGKRAKIYAVNAKTGKLENGIGFYLNGKLVKDPHISIKEWNFLGISFANTLDFSNYLGYFNINGPLTMNTISYYQSTNLQEVQQTDVRPWFQVKRSGSLILDWKYWDSGAFLWQNVLIVANTSLYGANPSDIYKTYTGTKKFIIDDDQQVRLSNAEYTIYRDITWQSQTRSAV